MPIEAIVAALLSAVIHASWNAAFKSGQDRLADLPGMGLGAMLLGTLIILWRGLPLAAAWPYLAGSAAVHVIYWNALLRGYEKGDMSHVYPIARGLAPLLVALGALIVAAGAMLLALGGSG